MVSMSPRERVLLALRHEEPDRVPTALFGSYYCLHDQTYFNLLKYLDISEPVVPFRQLKARNSNYIDDRILEKLGTDIRYVWLGFDDLVGPDPITGMDAWGVKWARLGEYITPVEYPLANASISDLENYPWPDPIKLIRVDELNERMKSLRGSKYAIVARAVSSYGPFEQAQTMRGREQFLIDLIDNPEFAANLIHKITQVILHLTKLYLDVVGPHVDIIEIPGDDYGGTNNLLISPKIFNHFLKPALKDIVTLIKSFRGDLTVAFHSDGAIVPLIPELIDLGIDILHPLEPLQANNRDLVKAEFGNRLTILGAIDIKDALMGSLEDIEKEVKQSIRSLAPGGGYILAPANHLHSVPPENIVALFRYANTYGRYPIS